MPTQPPPMPDPYNADADITTDSFAERVLRNEGRLEGHIHAWATARQADRELIAQRADSLALELERRATALDHLARTEREADVREAREALTALRAEIKLHRELFDTAIDKNFEQSQAALAALSNRVFDALAKLELLVTGWRASDREALNKQADEYARRLDVLNHAHERQSEFARSAVTRELWQADKDSAAGHVNVLRDQIIALDRALLGMTPLSTSDKAHADISLNTAAAIAASAETLNTKINVLDDKLAELKTFMDVSQGGSTRGNQMYGWLVAAVIMLASIITVANVLTTK